MPRPFLPFQGEPESAGPTFSPCPKNQAPTRMAFLLCPSRSPENVYFPRVSKNPQLRVFYRKPLSEFLEATRRSLDAVGPRLSFTY